MAVATGIAPSELLATDLEIFNRIVDRVSKRKPNARK